MDICFNCSQCGQRLIIDAAGAHQVVACPTCHHSLVVPGISARDSHEDTLSGPTGAEFVMVTPGRKQTPGQHTAPESRRAGGGADEDLRAFAETERAERDAFTEREKARGVDERYYEQEMERVAKPAIPELPRSTPHKMGGIGQSISWGCTWATFFIIGWNAEEILAHFGIKENRWSVALLTGLLGLPVFGVLELLRATWPKRWTPKQVFLQRLNPAFLASIIAIAILLLIAHWMVLHSASDHSPPANAGQPKANFVASAMREPFHRRGCEWAQKIESQNLQKYSTREEAIADKHVACRVCRP